jgi:ankyrin repeat protein
MATELGLFSVVKKLLSTHTAQDKKPDLGKLMSIAVRSDSSELVDFLLREGAKREDAVVEAASQGQIKYLEKLTSHGPYQLQPAIISSAMHNAAQGGNVTAVELLSRLFSKSEWQRTNPNQCSLLHSATIGGRVEILKHLLAQDDFDLDAQDEDGNTALIMAAKFGHNVFVKELCDRGADVNLANKENICALHHGIVKGPELVNLLLQSGANPDKADNFHRTPLHLSARIGDLEVTTDLVRTLTRAEAINTQDQNQQTALHIAATFGHTRIAQLLLENGADVAIVDKNAESPFEVAASAGHLKVLTLLHARRPTLSPTNETLLAQAATGGSFLIVQHLLEAGAAINTYIKDETALMKAASHGCTEVARLLLEWKGDPDLTDKDGCSALGRAVRRGYSETALALLDKGASANTKGDGGWPVLHLAGWYHMDEVVATLLEKGADIGARAWTGDTALHVSTAYPDIVQKLISYGAELAAKNSSDETPLHIAVRRKHFEAARVLAAHDINLIKVADERCRTPLHRLVEAENWDVDLFQALCQKIDWLDANLSQLDWQSPIYKVDPLLIYSLKIGNWEAVNILLQNSALVSTTNSRGATPLHYAASEAPLSIVKKLVKLGCDVNATDRGGTTPLYDACSRGKSDTAAYLLAEAGADPTIRNSRRETALHGAVSAMCNSTLDVLLPYCKDINPTDGAGWPPLYFAVQLGYFDGVRKLLSANANIEIKDSYGKTALHVAVEGRNIDMTDILLNAGADMNATDNAGKTALHYAADRALGTVILRLVEHGAELGVEDNEGRSPLHLGAASPLDMDMGRVVPGEPLHILVNAHHVKGYSVEERDHTGLTPLHQALIDGDWLNTQILIEGGADIGKRDRSGRSCLEMAAGSRSCIKKLKLLFNADSDSGTSHWTAKDKAAAFKVASPHIDACKLIAEHDAEIFRFQEETSAILHYCIDKSDFQGAVEFLKMGANPFIRTSRRLSPLERIFLDGSPSNEFYAACQEKVQDDMLQYDEKFQVLRICIELGLSSLYANLAHWQEDLCSNGIADPDGWTIETFLHQNNGAHTIECPSLLPDVLVQTPTRLTVPDFFESRQRTDAFNFSEERSEVQYLSELPHLTDWQTEIIDGFVSDPLSDSSAMSVRSDHPFPPRDSGISYFEIFIIPTTEPGETHGRLGIGLCGEYVDMSYSRLGSPSRNPSLGYFGDNGMVYTSLPPKEIGPLSDATYGPGDTVGCGINWLTGSTYFTLNGRLIGTYPRSYNWYKQ